MFNLFADISDLLALCTYMSEITPCRHSKIMGLIYWKYVYQIKIARCSISGNGIVRIFLEQKVKILITPFWFQRPLSEGIWFELLVILIAKMC